MWIRKSSHHHPRAGPCTIHGTHLQHVTTNHISSLSSAEGFLKSKSLSDQVLDAGPARPSSSRLSLR